MTRGLAICGSDTAEVAVVVGAVGGGIDGLLV